MAKVSLRSAAVDDSPLTRVSPQARAFTLLAMTLAALYFLIPVWWLMVSATKSPGQLFTSAGFWFADFNLVENLKELFSVQDGIYAVWLRNSVIYAVGGALGSTLISVMAGYALAKYPFKGRGAVFAVILGAVLIPAPVFAVPLYLLFSGTGVINTMWSVFIPALVSPFGVYLARIYAASSVPDSLLEAGRLDGASEMRIFFQVSVRLMAPAMVTILLFQFVSVWTNYLLPSLMLADSRLQPVTVGLITWQEARGITVGYSSVITGAFVSVIPIIILFLSLQNFWAKGLASGAVK